MPPRKKADYFDINADDGREAVSGGRLLSKRIKERDAKRAQEEAKKPKPPPPPPAPKPKPKAKSKPKPKKAATTGAKVAKRDTKEKTTTRQRTKAEWAPAVPTPKPNRVKRKDPKSPPMAGKKTPVGNKTASSSLTTLPSHSSVVRGPTLNTGTKVVKKKAVAERPLKTQNLGVSKSTGKTKK